MDNKWVICLFFEIKNMFYKEEILALIWKHLLSDVIFDYSMALKNTLHLLEFSTLHVQMILYSQTICIKLN